MSRGHPHAHVTPGGAPGARPRLATALGIAIAVLVVQLAGGLIHVVVDDATLAVGHGGAGLDRITSCLAEDFDVRQCTFQLEAAGHRAHEGLLHD